mgnify:CR=1 FL=1
MSSPNPLESDTIVQCQYCPNMFDIEGDYDDLDKLHRDHVEFMYHWIDEGICPTCEGDEPLHCPAYTDGMIDNAMMQHDR